MQKKQNNYIKNIYIYNLCGKEAKSNNKVMYPLRQQFRRKNKRKKERK